MPQVLCASPEYLIQFGEPSHPDELAAHQIGKFFSSGTVDNTLELLIDGHVREFALEGWMSVNDAESYVVSALRGCGLIQLPRFHVEDELRDGHLVEVLSEWSCPDLPLSALYPSHRQLSPRVRVFIDWLTQLYEEKFGAAPKAPSV
jgi:LysR family transcriptional regulator, regulator for bpeEF and oprC